MNASRRAIGFDLGTTISVAATVGPDGIPRTINDSSGSFLVPSAVYFGDDVTVGESAMAAGLSDPEGFAEGFKRDIGKPHYERDIRFCQVPPEVLTAFLVEHLVNRVRDNLGPVHEAVVTVPAYFDEKKRTSTQQAARLAGLKVLDIINEPTAAAIAAAHQLLREQAAASRGRRILVYDLGGGTFDVTLLELRGRTFHTLGTDGDIHLGGRDFDERIVSMVAERFLDRHGVDPRSNAVDLQRLWRLAVDVKHQLSTQERHPVSFKFADLLLGFELSRREFEDAIEPLVERTIATSRYVVEDAGMQWDKIDELLLVGGSSRIPLVAQKLSEQFGRPVRLAEKPDELIAHGAALYAATRAEQPFLAEDAAFDIVNVNAHSLGVQGVDVETKQKVNKIIIHRNTPLPTAKSQKFVTYREGQRNVKVRLLEGESENPAFCTVLGDCVVRLDPPVPQGSEIRINCQYDANGTISVSARIPSTKASAYVELRRDGFSVLEPLKVWRSRLTSGDEAARAHQLNVSEGVPDAAPLADTTDLKAVIARIDELHAFVGNEATDVAPPVSAVAVQRLVKQLEQETMTLKLLIKHLESRHHREKDFQKKVILAGHLAHAKMSWEQSTRLRRHSIVTLGRECVVGGVVPEKATQFLGEIHQLSSVLDAEFASE